MEMQLTVLISLGLGVVVCSLSLMICERFKDLIFTSRFRFGDNYRIGKLLNKVKRYIKGKARLALSKKEKVIMVVLSLALAGTARNIKQVPKFTLLGSLLSFIVISVYQRTLKATSKANRLRESAILFEAIELYINAGYSLYQAIRASRILVDEIRPAVDSCLNYWGAGTKKALEMLEVGIGLDEVNTLILLLINMESSGDKELKGTIGKVVFSIEDLQKMKSQIKISNRPLVFVIYRMLPLMSIAGIIVGGLLYRTYRVLEMTGFIKF